MNTIIMNAKNIVNIGVQNNINGRIINEGGFSAGETKKIDKNKQVEIGGISKIKIDSNVSDVTIFACDQKDIKVHYYGEVCTDGEIEFNVTKLNDEINISEKIYANTINSSLKLDVLIPQKIFESISVKCENGSIKILKNVEAQHLKIKSRNGKIKSEAFFEEITAKTINGKIAIAICAKSNIEISASSVNSKVIVELENIGFCGISASSVNGRVSKRYSNTGKYEATGKISSINGSVRIQ